MTSNYHIRWPEYGIFITAEHSIRHSCRHSLHVLWALFLTLLTPRYSKYFHLALLLRKPNLRNDLAKFMNRASGRVKHNFKLVCFISRRTSLYHVSWSQFLIMKPPLSKVLPKDIHQRTELSLSYWEFIVSQSNYKGEGISCQRSGIDVSGCLCVNTPCHS